MVELVYQRKVVRARAHIKLWHLVGLRVDGLEEFVRVERFFLRDFEFIAQDVRVVGVDAVSAMVLLLLLHH